MDLSFWLEISQGRFITALLIFARLGGVLFSAPLLSSHSIPTPVRVGLAALFSLILTPLMPALQPGNILIFGAGLVKEFMIGLALGWIASLMFSCVQMAGEWLDVQAGFQMAQLFNPVFQAGGGPLGNLKYILAGMLFLAVNGHAIVLQAAAESFRISPPGALVLGVGSVDDWFSFLVKAIWLSIQIAAPVGVTLFMSEMALSIVNRTLPQFNVLMLSMPLKAMLALLTLSTALPSLGNALALVFVDFGNVLVSALRILKG
ncbi:flagellar biosynthetic protein FliR [Armatimonas sp.]|uniref:flagellar biosynthetic protein FliR n=1 Tax=Armatimonas sp. TaxID=1872638 RepID=UPI00286A96BB|nr:flagellar biosynthetic protein FliR [Armatimonas sp.]